MRRLASLSHYQLLGVPPEADADTIKRSYIALAKEFHPDRFFRPEFEDLQESVNAIFMRISEAYATLNNPASRAEYDREALRADDPGGAGRRRRPRIPSSPRSSSRRGSPCSTRATSGRRSRRCAGR